MRQLLRLVLCGVLALCAASCGRSDAAVSPTVRRGEFRVLVPARPATLNPNLQLDEMALVIGRSLFNQLVTVNESGRVLPDLAERWTISPDGLVYTFTLRPAVRWHDGAPFGAEDVKWTLQTAVADGFAGRGALDPVASVTTPNAQTVEITLKYPWAPFITDLAGPGVSILPRHIYQGRDWRNHPANDRPIGTGPFKFRRWENENTLVLEANTTYFRPGPYVERVVFEVAEPESVGEKLLADAADYSVTRPPSVAIPAPAPERLVVRTLPSSARFYVAMNLRREPFADVRVRRAMAAAVDRLEIVRDSLSGLGAPAIGWYTPDVEWAYNPGARVPEFDLKTARRLLDDAGFPMRGRQRFATTLLVPNAPPIWEMAELLSKQWAAIGIAVTVERISPADWPTRAIGAHDFDLTVISGGQGPDPDQLRRRYAASAASGAYIGYASPEFEEAVQRGAREVDIAARAQAYSRAQEILARDVPIIPLAESVKIVVYNRRVSGLPQLEARGLVGGFDFSLVKLAPDRSASSR